MQDLRSVAERVHLQEKSALIANHELLLMDEKRRVCALEKQLAEQQHPGPGQQPTAGLLGALKDIILGRLLDTSVEALNIYAVMEQHSNHPAEQPRAGKLVSIIIGLGPLSACCRAALIC